LASNHILLSPLPEYLGLQTCTSTLGPPVHFLSGSWVVPASLF
jgi:hypothetical protein